MQSLVSHKNILKKQEVQTELLLEASSQIPGSVHYSIKRYARPQNWIADDVGVNSSYAHEATILSMPFTNFWLTRVRLSA